MPIAEGRRERHQGCARRRFIHMVPQARDCNSRGGNGMCPPAFGWAWMERAMTVAAASRPWLWRRIVPALIVAALCGVFGMLADEVTEGETLSFDTSVLKLFREPGNLSDPIGPPWLEEAVRDVTSLGSFSLLGLITVLAVATLLLRGKWRTGWSLAFAVIGGAILSTGLKALFDRPRPDITDVTRVFTASFPSGHATVSAVVFLTIGVMLAEAAETVRLRVFYLGVAILLTLVVGVTRIYLGVHYPTDVLAGWLLGSAWALLCWVAVEIFLKPTATTPSR
jgi:undecaprenyl-diphosphatase